MVNVVCRLAVEHDCLAEQAIALSAKLGLEGVTLHFAIFPKFWTDLYQSQTQMRDGSVRERVENKLDFIYNFNYFNFIRRVRIKITLVC